MATVRFTLNARVSTDRPDEVETVLRHAIPTGTIARGDVPGEFRVVAELEGTSARDLNRQLLSELRRAEKKTRLRSEWTSEGVTERFFDYVPKGRARA